MVDHTRRFVLSRTETLPDPSTAKLPSVSKECEQQVLSEYEHLHLGHFVWVRTKTEPQFWMAVHRAPAKDIVSDSITYDGTWERDITETINKILCLNCPSSRNSSFLDVGANIGYFSLLAAARGYRVDAFEPMSMNVALLKLSLCANPGIAARFTIYPYGTSTEKKHCFLISDPSNVGDGHTVCLDSSDPSPVNASSFFPLVVRNEFHTVRLDETLLNRPGSIIFMKIDVEGQELTTFTGATALLENGVILNFCSEVDENMLGKENVPKLFDLFWRNGYSLFADFLQSQTVLRQTSDYFRILQDRKLSAINVCGSLLNA